LFDVTEEWWSLAKGNKKLRKGRKLNNQKKKISEYPETCKVYYITVVIIL